MSIFITGVGQTAFGKWEEKSLEVLMQEAVEVALLDAGINPLEIDAVFVGNMIGPSVINQGHLGTMLNDMFGISCPAFRIDVGCASGGAALSLAYNYCKANKCANVLVVGVEKMSTKPSSEIASYLMQAAHRNDWESGLTFPHIFGLIAQRYCDEYSLAKELLAYPSLKSHSYGCDNQYAHFQKEVTIEKILHSAVVADPLNLLHCAPISDGAAAVVLSSNKKNKAIEIVASAMATDTLSLSNRKIITEFVATQNALQKALSSANISIEDIDVFEVHDGFSIVEIITMEDLGLCPKGKGGNFIFNGNTLREGSKPVNILGGLKAGGHPVGATGVRQAVTMGEILRDQKKDIFKKKCEYGLLHNVGGVGSSVVIHILKNPK